MSLNPDRRSKALNLVESPAFPNNFIVRVKNTELERATGKHATSTHDPPSSLKHNSTGTRWSLNSIPNLKGIPNGRMKPRLRLSHRLTREDTFDEDFMMPSRVREVLQSEGLENNVITWAIGKSEAKHKDTLRKMTEDSVPIYPRDVLQGQQQAATTTQRSPGHYTGSLQGQQQISMTTQRSPGHYTGSLQGQQQTSMTTQRSPGHYIGSLQGQQQTSMTTQRSPGHYTGSLQGQQQTSMTTQRSPGHYTGSVEGQQQTAMTTQRSPGHNEAYSPTWLSVDSAAADSRTNTGPQTSDQSRGWRVGTFSTSALYKNLNLDSEDIRLETDKRKWLNEQTEEQMFCGRKIKCPRVVLVSSKIQKCQQLFTFCQEDVLIVIYDFDSWSFADIIETIAKRLQCYRKYCKARSIMLYCQGGPGYIYLLRNYVITPQKMQKPSYRGVIEFWKTLGGLLSKLRPAEAVVHIVGFRLLDDEQGHKLLPMLQGIMYPNLVRVEVPDEGKEAGRIIIGHYFQHRKYKLWKSHCNDRTDEDNKEQTGITTSNRHGEVKKLTLSIR